MNAFFSLFLAATMTISAEPLANDEVLEPSVCNEVNHALSQAYAYAALPCGQAAEKVVEAQIRGLSASAAAIRLVSSQRADGSWFSGTNDITLAVAAHLRRLAGIPDDASSECQIGVSALFDKKPECIIDVFRVPIRKRAAFLSFPRARIPSGAREVRFAPAFAWARKGEDGYFVMPQGGGAIGHFTREKGSLICRRNWFPITAHGMKTPRCTFVAMPKGLRWEFDPAVVVTGGLYRVSTLFVLKNGTAREDPAIKYVFLEGANADYSGMGRAVRAERFADGEMRTLTERMKGNPTLAYVVGTPIIRIRQAWKSRKYNLPDQNLIDEPPVDVYCTFDRVKTFAAALKRAGLERADICLVGWNCRGHDGRYPQAFPVEEALGGEAKLKEAIRYVRDEIGYQIVGHMNYRDAYLIADCFDFEYCLNRLPDGTRNSASREPWSGGANYHICPRRAYERFALKHTAMMKSLGFSGLGYLDVTTSRPLLSCDDARHPLDCAQSRVYELAMLDLQTQAFGACSSEGGYDWALGHFDSGLTISYEHPFDRKKWNSLVDDRIPFWQIAYHGVIMSNPFRTTWNLTSQTNPDYALKATEFGGRPVFYVYGWWDRDGDLKLGTDAELADCVDKIMRGMEDYNRRAHLEAAFMESHECLSKDVRRTTYSDGSATLVNYGLKPVTVEGVVVGAKSWQLVPPKKSTK